jgi:hypothetical protein
MAGRDDRQPQGPAVLALFRSGVGGRPICPVRGAAAAKQPGSAPIVETFSIVAAVAVSIETLALIALHLLPTGYNPVRDAVSDYGVGRYREIFWLQVLAGAVAGFALAVALEETSPSIPSVVVALLAIASAARLLIPFFPTDQDGSRFQTVHGTIHMILAVTIFVALILAASELASALEHRPAWHGVKGWLTTLPWVMTGAAVGLVLGLRAPRLRLIYGLMERVFLLASIAWFLIVSIELARIAG